MSPTLLLLTAAIAAPPAPVNELKLPPGFTARLYTDNPIAPDIYTMTIDDAGRVLVAGRGYVRVLVEKGDGSADRAIDLIDGLKDGPMGLLVEGDSLFVVADGGLKRYRGYNGKDKLKGPPETLIALKTSGEHDAHAVRRGPDGWLYLLCGNAAGVRKAIITGARSPVKEPIAGALLRISPDYKSVEVVADGFRNPYSFDFNLDGEPFTYDSDNERCVGLPWYEGCRFYHVVPGGNHGWRSPQLSQTWRKPPYFPDVVPPVCDTGRGSPTGVVCYRHTHFPAEYHGGFFLADWTFGRIYAVPLKPAGSSYSGKYEVFAEAVGTSGFAPTALAVHPKTGELFVSIGGRGTRGGVYRISYDKAEPNPKPLAMAKRSLEFDKEAAKQWLADCNSADARKRRIALEMLARWWDKCEWGETLGDAVRPNLAHTDRLIRRAAGRIGKEWYVELGTVTDLQSRLTLALAEVGTEPARARKVALAAIGDSHVSSTEVIEALRIIHLAYGDLTAKDAVGTVWEGYSVRKPISDAEAEQLRTELAKAATHFAGSDLYREPILELARMYAILGGGFDAPVRTTTIEWIGPKTAEADDFHCLIALSCTNYGFLRVSREDVPKALMGLLKKVQTQKVLLDRHWPLRFDEMLTRLAKNWPNVAQGVLEHEDFGQPEHIALVKPLGIARAEAAKKFLAVAATEPGFVWNANLVELMGALPEDTYRPLLERLWKRPELRDAIIAVLAKQPKEDDRPKFSKGLQSFSPEVVRISAVALKAVTGVGLGYDTELVTAIKALRRLAPEDKAARAAVTALLQHWTSEKLDGDPKVWTLWLAKNRPAWAPLLNAADDFYAPAWQKRQAGIDWAKGNAERGRAAFAKATCAACHDGGRAVGPSLLGIGKRFSRDDLLTAILQPSKDISPRYRATRIATTDERAYTGIVIYEATDGVILQTGADTTVRIAGANIASKNLVDVSLMPAGLIDKLSDAEIADLLAYLRTLGDAKP